jgi:NAD(P)-dependent dehydrogenase (short-subunit alcohol dehydrogenase family)
LKVWGYIALTKIYWAKMKERRQGVILNDIGNSCERTDYNYVAGSSGNASLVAFTRCLGGVSMDYGVRILAVSPGPVDTGRLETMLKKRATLPEWGGQEAGWQVGGGGAFVFVTGLIR